MNLKRRYLVALRRHAAMTGIYAPYRPVMEAPAWLKRRMERLRAQPPPTIEEVRAQWAAGQEQLRRRDREALGDSYR